MGIFDKTKSRVKGSKKSSSKDSVVRMPEPSTQFEEHLTALKSSLNAPESEDKIEVDIRLDQDLSNFEMPAEKSLYKNADIDFDLTNPREYNASYTETQVLDINPLKSFSRQVDIDMVQLNKNGYITPDNPNSPLSHAFRAIKRPLLNNVAGKGATVVDNANLIMVTSSLSSEGKTFSTINLAISMAMERDKKILLIDADANKPSHHEIFGIDMEFGLTDLLMGKVNDVSKVISKTNLPSLSLMFAGSRTPHATELFASQAMTDFLLELSKRYDDRVIIFDSAPLLLPTEASVLATQMGQVVVVVEAEITGQALVKRALDMLDNRIKLILLNKVREKNDFGTYGYYGNVQEP